MRCKPKLQEASMTQTMWLKTLTSVSLLTLSNVIQHFNLIQLDFLYHILINLLINNIVTLFCCHRNIHFIWDFVWKLTTSLSQLNEHCFQAKVAIDILMILNEIIEHFKISSTKRLHSKSPQQLQYSESVTAHLERRPSIHKTRASGVETKVNETFLAHKIFSLNLGKSTGSLRRNIKKSSESESLNGFELPRVKLDKLDSSSLSFDEIPNTWGSPTFSSRNSDRGDCSSTSSSSSLVKPARLSFSPSEDNHPSRRLHPVDPSEQRPSASSLSHTLYYSSTPRVVYVQIPSAVAEQGYLKLVCYLFTLVVVYIIYNEYRLSRMYAPGQQV